MRSPATCPYGWRAFFEGPQQRRPRRIDDVHVAVDRTRQNLAASSPFGNRDERGPNRIELTPLDEARRRDDVGSIDRHARVEIRSGVDLSDRDRVDREIQRVGEAGHAPQVMIDIDTDVTTTSAADVRAGATTGTVNWSTVRSSSSRSSSRFCGRNAAGVRAFHVLGAHDAAVAQPRFQIEGETSSAITVSACARNDIGTSSRIGKPRMRSAIGATVSRCCTLKAPSTDFSGVAERERVLPALGVRGFGRIAMGEFVEHDRLGIARQRRLEIEILEASVGARRDARQP